MGDRTLAANIVEKILDVFPDVSAEWLMRNVVGMEFLHVIVMFAFVLLVTGWMIGVF